MSNQRIPKSDKDEAIDRLVNEIQTGRTGEIGDFLLSHLAKYGPDGIDVQAMAVLIEHRIENEE